MNTSSSHAPKPYVVVAAADDGPDGQRVIEAASAHLANRIGSQLHIVHLAPVSELRSEATLDLLEHGRATLDLVAREAREPCRPRLFVHIVAGFPWRAIVAQARKLSADLIVMGTHGRTGTARLLHGSQGEEVMRHAPCALLVVRDVYPEDPSPNEPEIEAPCPACALLQEQSDGEASWCAVHAKHRVKAHTHYETPASFGSGSWLIRP